MRSRGDGMDGKKILQITVAVLLTVIVGFGTWWTAVNAKALGAFFAGEKITYNSQLAPEREYYQTKIKELDDLISDFEFKLSEALASDATKETVIESFRAQVSVLQTNALTLSSQVSEQIALNEKLASDNEEFSFFLIQMQKQLLGYVAMVGRFHDLIVYMSDTIISWESRTEYIATFYVRDIHGVHIWDLQIINHINTNIVAPSVPEGDFLGWSLNGDLVDPTQIVIASDIEFYAVFLEAVSFATDSEETIDYVVEAIKNGADPMSFPYRVGDKRDIQLDTSEVITFEIWGIQHDDLSDGSGKAPYTLGMENLLETMYQMSPNNQSNTNVGGWDASYMRNTVLPTIFSQLPVFWRSLIKTVTKKASVGERITELQTSEDKLFLFAEEEIMSANSNGVAGEGTQYEYWRTIKNGTTDPKSPNSERVKCFLEAGTAWVWWLRSPSLNSAWTFCTIGNNGNGLVNNSGVTNGVCFGFCI